jgi:long-chain acyl-CoA synthetase
MGEAMDDWRDDLERWAYEHPSKMAIVMAENGESWDFARLDREADAARAWLLSLDIADGATIAMLIENRPELIALWYAARRAGLYFAPISTLSSAPEVAHVVADSEAVILIASELYSRIAIQASSLLGDAGPVHRVMLGNPAPGFIGLTEAIAGGTSTKPFPERSVGREFLYSSGTTGKPKGVRRPLTPYSERWKLPRFETYIRGIFKMAPDMVYLSLAPLYHATGRFLTRTIDAGGTAIVMGRFDAAAALEAIERYQVTHSLWVPTMFARLLAVADADRRARDISSLRLALHGAAPCPPAVKMAMLGWWGDVVEEFYGGTENLGLTHIGAADWRAHPGSVGRCVSGDIHILSEDGSENELAAGEIGSVYFSGGLPFAYHRDEAKSRAALSTTGWGSYGDLGHVDEDGYLYLSDRRTDLIITGGVNVYPREVEDVLERHAVVAEAAVIGLGHADLGQMVVAVVRLLDGSLPTSVLADALSAHCRAVLSPVKCPRQIIFADALPMNENGKLLKRVLRERYTHLAATKGMSA